jgi:hypothetical protein
MDASLFDFQKNRDSYTPHTQPPTAVVAQTSPVLTGGAFLSVHAGRALQISRVSRRAADTRWPAALPLQMISDIDIERSAWVLIKQYGGDALLEAKLRADELLEDGDWLGAFVWQRILEAIERLQAKAAARGEKMH